VYGYAASLAIGGVVELIAVPFLLASRQQHPQADQSADSTSTSTAESPPS
jgi:hypothetical protein